MRLSWKELDENPAKNGCTLTNQCFERTIQFFQISARNWIQKRPAIGVWKHTKTKNERQRMSQTNIKDR